MAANTGRETDELKMLHFWRRIEELVEKGSRDPAEVHRVLQVIKDKPNFVQELFPEKSSPAPKVVGTRTGFRSLLRDWQKFYLEVFNRREIFTHLQTPTHQEGFDFLVIMAQGLTLEAIFQKLKEKMPAWKYADNLNTITSDRSPKSGTYAVWFRDRQEADEELKNLSANQLKTKNISGITLEERLIMELFYYWKKGLHLDLKNSTLCSGSRDSDGAVPGVGWGDGRVGVDWYYPSSAYGGLRARAAVS